MSSCNGRALPLQVTLPNDPNFWEGLSVFYSYVPWFLCLGIALLFLIIRGSRELSVGLMPGLIAGINELLKLGIDQPRPAESCLTSEGMPSSHSAVSIGLFLFLVLDGTYRLSPRSGRSIECNCGETALSMAEGWLVLPFGTLSQPQFAAYLATWTLLLIPVPLARVILNDHTPSQAFAGSLVGMFAVSLWFPLTLWFRRRFRDRLGEKFSLIFTHNYEPPVGWTADDPKGETEPIVASPTSAIISSPEDVV